MKGIIYKYTFPDGKVYIGQTRRHPEERKREHLDASIGPTNSGFWEAYKRFGEPKYEVLFEIERENEDELVFILNHKETMFIHQYKATNPEFGYNIMPFGTTHTNSQKILRQKNAEIIEKSSEKPLKIFERALNKILYTKETLTDEESFLIKEKYRDSNPFQSYIDELYLKNLSNDFDEETDFFLYEALEYVKFEISQEIEDVASQYINENYKEILDEEKRKNTIVQLDKEGNVIREFYSFNEICQVFNVPRAENVRNVLKGKQKSAYGFNWKYKKDL